MIEFSLHEARILAGLFQQKTFVQELLTFIKNYKTDDKKLKKMFNSKKINISKVSKWEAMTQNPYVSEGILLDTFFTERLKEHPLVSHQKVHIRFPVFVVEVGIYMNNKEFLAMYG